MHMPAHRHAQHMCFGRKVSITWPTKPQTLGQNWLVEAASTAFWGLHLQPQQTTHMFSGLGPNSPMASFGASKLQQEMKRGRRGRSWRARAERWIHDRQRTWYWSQLVLFGGSPRWRQSLLVAHSISQRRRPPWKLKLQRSPSRWGSCYI